MPKTIVFVNRWQAGANKNYDKRRIDMKKQFVKLIAVFGLALVMALSAISAAFAEDPKPIVPLTDPMAPFLESRAFAKSKGATAEFNKMEWVAIDPVKNKLYMAMTDTTKAMSDKEGAIKLTENRCGIVYVADLDKDYNTSASDPWLLAAHTTAVGLPTNAQSARFPTLTRSSLIALATCGLAKTPPITRTISCGAMTPRPTSSNALPPCPLALK